MVYCKEQNLESWRSEQESRPSVLSLFFCNQLEYVDIGKLKKLYGKDISKENLMREIESILITVKNVRTCTDTGFNLEDLPEVMDERDGWREKVRKIIAFAATWWWSYQSKIW